MLAIAVLIAWAVAPAFVPAFPVAPCFDRILLKDGRVIEGDLLPSTDASVTKLSIAGIEVPVRNDLIAKTFAENLANYKPKNAQEEENLKKGFVLFEGDWMSVSRRDAEVKKRADADKLAVQEIKKRANWKSATTTSSSHFEIRSNCDPDVVKDYTDRLEAFYKAFTTDWSVKPSTGKKGGKLTVDIHRYYADDFSIGWIGNTLVFAFDFDSGAISLTHDPDDIEDSLEQLYLSASWQLIFSSYPNFLYPLWIRDGLSEYFGSTEVGANGKFVFGKPMYRHCLVVMEAQDKGTLPPLIEAVMTEEYPQRYVHTSLRWAFVHFLLESPKYGKAFRSFYSSLPNNPDAKIQQRMYRGRKAAMDVSDDADCLAALEKRLGVKLDQLEKEMLESFKTMSSQLTAKAYYQAAQRALSRAVRDDDEDELSDDQRMELVKSAFAHMARADEMGLEKSRFYRRYAELLRKGGIKEDKRTLKPMKPDPAAAFKMIEHAIAIDPLAPYSYTEAAGILIMDGPTLNLDRAEQYAKAGLAIGGARNSYIKSMYDELMKLIEDGRETIRNRSQADHRKWHVAFSYKQGEQPPPNLADLSTDELRTKIRAGEVIGRDHLYQSWQENDADGKPVAGDNPWDKDWVDVSTVPLFADDLAAAAQSASEPTASPADPAGDPGANPGAEPAADPSPAPAPAPDAPTDPDKG